MRITIAEVRRVIRSVIGEAFGSPGTGFKLTGPDGVEYEGERNAVRTALVSSSRLDAAARNEVMDTGSAPAEVIALLKRASLIKRTSPRRAPTQPANRKPRQLTIAQAQRAYERARDEFIRDYGSYEFGVGRDDPGDVEAAAADTALEFFHNYPEWKEWFQALGDSKFDIQGSITDDLYDAMMKGRE